MSSAWIVFSMLWSFGFLLFILLWFSIAIEPMKTTSIFPWYRSSDAFDHGYCLGAKIVDRETTHWVAAGFFVKTMGRELVLTIYMIVRKLHAVADVSGINGLACTAKCLLHTNVCLREEVEAWLGSHEKTDEVFNWIRGRKEIGAHIPSEHRHFSFICWIARLYNTWLGVPKLRSLLSSFSLHVNNKESHNACPLRASRKILVMAMHTCSDVAWQHHNLQKPTFSWRTVSDYFEPCAFCPWAFVF
jgi:hypothetical protein